MTKTGSAHKFDRVDPDKFIDHIARALTKDTMHTMQPYPGNKRKEELTYSSISEFLSVF